MIGAFRLRYTFPVAVELSDEDRADIVQQAVAMAEKLDLAKGDFAIFDVELHGKSWKLVVRFWERTIHIMSKEEADKAGLPENTSGESGSA